MHVGGTVTLTVRSQIVTGQMHDGFWKMEVFSRTTLLVRAEKSMVQYT